MDELMRKHFDLHGIEYEDTFSPQFVKSTWEEMRAACESMCKEYHDVKSYS